MVRGDRGKCWICCFWFPLLLSSCAVVWWFLDILVCLVAVRSCSLHLFICCYMLSVVVWCVLLFVVTMYVFLFVCCQFAAIKLLLDVCHCWWWYVCCLVLFCWKMVVTFMCALLLSSLLHLLVVVWIILFLDMCSCLICIVTRCVLFWCCFLLL